MTKWWWWPFLSWRSLRFRLISWYVLLLILTLTAFSVYLFFQFRDLQQAQQDTLLQAAVSKSQPLLDNGPAQPYLRKGFGSDSILQDLARANIQLRLLNRDKQVIDSLGASVAEMPLSSPTASSTGFATVDNGDKGQWRIYSQSISGRDGNGGVKGWIQVGQPAFVLNTELGRLFTPIGLGALVALLLAILGGLFLANQALKPIDRVTRTAQTISTRDLSRRINYHGPADEIGRLALTLDQMFDRLEKGFEQERRFTSDASHELRTPLTALKGRIEVTLNRLRDPQDYQETLETLNVEVDRLIRLSSSLLYLARLDQAGQSWQSESLNLSDLLDSMVDSMQAVAELRQIELSLVTPPDLHLQGNLDQLTRLFLNLLDNALKYTPPRGRVKVRVERTGDQATVAVSDNGPGIAAKHLPHLFKRFYRAESDRASTSGGAGLGLAIAYEITRQHGGRLEVESQPGQGTTFKVQLPLLPLHAQVLHPVPDRG